MADDDRIDEIIGTWCEIRDRGDAFDPEEVCRQHPDLADELRARFVALEIIEQACAEPAAGASIPPQIGDYRILREIGRGGMGVVYEAEQASLERRVALKVLSLAITGTAQAVKRFQREAKAAARLHHTNIVPVYGMGQHAGYWYYAMELVEGRPLNAVIGELQGIETRPTEDSLARLSAATGTGAERAGPEPVTGSRELPDAGTGNRAYFIRIAEMFAGVADALDLAHQQGVIHRDIKPSNLLLDADGMLKIVDFGLARFDDESLSMTITGDLLGTPVYMSPEQAMAKRIKLDRRTDVYSLGATLYEVLTLRPPFRADSLQELCSQIITKDPLLPRRTNRRIPRDLETIVLKAMEKDRDRRYQGARAFARDLRLFAEGSAIGARRIGPIERAWRRVRRHPVRATLAAGLLAALGVSVFLGLRASAEAERRRALDYARLCARAEHALIAALSRPAVEIPGGRFAIAEDSVVGETPEALYSAAIALEPDQLDAYVGRALTPGRRLADHLADLDAARARGLPPRTWHLVRADLLRVAGREEEARREAERAAEYPGRAPLDIYFEARALACSSRWAEARKGVTEVLAAEETDRILRYLALRLRATARMREEEHALALEDFIRIREMGDESPSVSASIASLWSRMGHTETAEQHLRDALAQARRIGTEASWLALSQTMHDHQDYEWMERATRAALEGQPASARLLSTHADALRHGNRLEDSLAACDRAIAVDRNLANAHIHRAIALLLLERFDEGLAAVDRALEIEPSNAAALVHRATALGLLGRTEQALVACDRALEIDPSHADTHYNRGVVLGLLGRPEDEVAAYDRAIEIDPGHAASRNNRACVLLDLGRFEEALAAWARAAEIDPGRAASHFNRGSALLGLGQFAEALAAFDRALEIHPNFAEAHVYRGLALGSLGRLEEAMAAHDRAIDIDPDLLPAHGNRGALLNRLGQFEDALAAFDRAIEIDPDSALIHRNRGVVLNRLGRFEDALAAYDRAIEIDPGNAEAHYGRGCLLSSDIEGAIDAYREAIRLRPDFAEAHCNLGHALMRRGRFQEALPHCRRGHELGSKLPAWSYPSKEWVESAERKAELEARLDRMLAGETQPRDASDRIGFAEILAAKGRHAESARMYAEAFAESAALAEDLASWHRYRAACSAALAASAEWRARALEWLRAELAARRGAATDLAATLEHWKRDADLAGVRDRLDELPSAEREAWTSLWAEVDALLERPKGQ